MDRTDKPLPGPAERGGQSRAARGRPVDQELTRRLQDAVLDLLAEEGLSACNADKVATRAHAGKAGIYRRWPTVPALIRGAMGDVRLVAVPDEQGSLRADLFALLTPWTRPLTRDERAAAALFSGARDSMELRQALVGALMVPLEQALTELFSREASRGKPVVGSRVRLTTMLVQALWWNRGVSHAPPMTANDVWSLIDEALLPTGPEETHPCPEDGHHTG